MLDMEENTLNRILNDKNHHDHPEILPTATSQPTTWINTNEIELTIIDSRPCLRDAMALTLNTQFPNLVSTADTVDAYFQNQISARSSQKSCDNSDRLIIYCTGSDDAAPTEQDIIKLREYSKHHKIVLLTDHVGETALNLYENQGINGIIPSSFNTKQFLACLSLVYSGVPFIPPELLNKSKSDAEDSNKKNNEAFINELLKKLTPRQRQVMNYIAIGKSNKYIAIELSLRESTVKAHVHELMKRLGASSRTHASYLINNLP